MLISNKWKIFFSFLEKHKLYPLTFVRLYNILSAQNLLLNSSLCSTIQKKHQVVSIVPDNTNVIAFAYMNSSCTVLICLLIHMCLCLHSEGLFLHSFVFVTIIRHLLLTCLPVKFQVYLTFFCHGIY